MKLKYLSGSTIPSTSANSVQVMKMCRSFSSALKDLGANQGTILYGHRGKSDCTDVYKRYAVERNFSIKFIQTSKFAVVRVVRRLVSILLDNFLDSRDTIFYGRDIFSIWLASRLNWNLVIEVHHLPKTSLQAILLKNILSRPSTLAIVVISESLKIDLGSVISKGNNVPPIIVAPDGADVPKNIPPAPGNVKLKVAYAGSLHKGRGIELILALANIYSHFAFEIAGENAKFLKDYNQSIPPNVDFLGHLEHCEIPGFLQQADVLLAPYQPSVSIGTGIDTSKWMSPLKIFEYMAAAKPIICSDLPATRQLIESTDFILYAPPNDIQAWSSLLDKLSSSSDLRFRYGKNAYHVLKNHYSWDARAKFIVDKIISYM